MNKKIHFVPILVDQSGWAYCGKLIPEKQAYQDGMVITCRKCIARIKKQDKA